MALPESVYGSLVELRNSLQESRLPQAELPRYGDPSHLFGFWFAHVAFLFLQRVYERRMLQEQGTPGSVIEAMANVAARVRETMKVPLPAPSHGSPLAIVASWLSLAGRAVGGSNWCIHGDGTQVPMDIFRHLNVPGRKELHMLCEDLHETQYDPPAGVGDAMRKEL